MSDIRKSRQFEKLQATIFPFGLSGFVSRRVIFEGADNENKVDEAWENVLLVIKSFRPAILEFYSDKIVEEGTWNPDSTLIINENLVTKTYDESEGGRSNVLFLEVNDITRLYISTETTEELKNWELSIIQARKEANILSQLLIWPSICFLKFPLQVSLHLSEDLSSDVEIIDCGSIIRGDRIHGQPIISFNCSNDLDRFVLVMVDIDDDYRVVWARGNCSLQQPTGDEELASYCSHNQDSTIGSSPGSLHKIIILLFEQNVDLASLKSLFSKERNFQSSTGLRDSLATLGLTSEPIAATGFTIETVIAVSPAASINIETTSVVEIATKVENPSAGDELPSPPSFSLVQSPPKSALRRQSSLDGPSANEGFGGSTRSHRTKSVSFHFPEEENNKAGEVLPEYVAMDIYDGNDDSSPDYDTSTIVNSSKGRGSFGSSSSLGSMGDVIGNVYSNGLSTASVDRLDSLDIIDPIAKMSLEAQCRYFRISNVGVFKGEKLSKKLSSDRFSKKRFIWIDALTRTLYWSKKASHKDAVGSRKVIALCQEGEAFANPKVAASSVGKYKGVVSRTSRLGDTLVILLQAGDTLTLRGVTPRHVNEFKIVIDRLAGCS